jgi:anaerobic carbon-monoxide dehydrogenase iron sulfur subunit
MPKRLVVDVQKCTECRSCELKCSFVHFSLYNPNKSGIRIVSDWPALARARLCIQCEDPACLPSCPSDALVLNDAGVVKVIYENCTACGSCVDACPYDGIWMVPVADFTVKCDTCDGRFLCIPDCFAGALSTVE